MGLIERSRRMTLVNRRQNKTVARVSRARLVERNFVRRRGVLLRVPYRLLVNDHCRGLKGFSTFIKFAFSGTGGMLDRVSSSFVRWTVLLFCLLSAVSSQLDLPPYRDEDAARQLPPNEINYQNILARLDFLGAERCSANVIAQWAYETNVNEYTQLQALDAQRLYADFQYQAWLLLSRIDINSIRDPIIRRRLRYLSVVGPSALPPDQLDRYNRLINDMLAIYNAATICAYNDPFRCGLRLYPDISQIMAKSRDWDELQYVWTEWRRRSGRPIRDLYHQLIALTNDAARMNNFTDAAEYWMFPYESPNFQQDIDEAWETIRPLYEELHAYIRRRLRDLYGPEKIGAHTPLPSHILGNIWGQSWTNLLDVTLPYPGKTYPDVTQEMRAQSSGFHEAVGEAVALSVTTPQHLQTLGLANTFIDERSADINYLFALAMDKLVLLPFSIAMDRWRWDVFRGYVNKEEYNCHWHRLKEQYTGTKPPVLRSEDDFDPGAKYHIPANIPYIRNFVAGVLQFQLYRALCQAAGQRSEVDNPRRPLHRCDFYRKPEAGRILGRLMERGSSIPWRDTLGEAIGEFRLDGSALREYFRPLEDWLRTENLRTGEVVGWSYDGDFCKRSIETAGLQVYGSGFYNSGTSISASWIVTGIMMVPWIVSILY
ncbi:PREDICTED: angiotensin-converting enzyme-like [Trachymyrmex septentrionalis]|uniref:angiotensin-converting enzyme-like n=1 Tax=Trachymyrmex septentrionalis TaxID=34720 RepID=UPI00084F569B|nr:PREDICTED: angiotensin-converting enzyme-like [Trachymyrmex septentrionalis]